MKQIKNIQLGLIGLPKEDDLFEANAESHVREISLHEALEMTLDCLKCYYMEDLNQENGMFQRPYPAEMKPAAQMLRMFGVPLENFISIQQALSLNLKFYQTDEVN